MSSPIPYILSIVTFLPLVGVLLIAMQRGEAEMVARQARMIALWTSMIVFLISLLLWIDFDPSTARFQFDEQIDWIPAFHIGYHAGIDGIEGPKTKAALSAYQQHEGLQQTAALDPQTMQRLGVNANAQANGNTGMTQGSSSTSTTQLSPSDLRGKLQQQGYNNVSDLKRNSDNSWSARADHNNQTVAVRVDAQSGRVLSEQTVASNAPNTSPDPSSGSSTPPAAPSTDNSTNH